MARTHNAQPTNNSTSRFHQDNGVVTGKGGVPLPTSPLRGVTALNPHGSGVVHVDDGEIIEPAPKVEAVYEWVCDKTTWQRNMDGWQALHLLNAMLSSMLGSELGAVLTQEQVQKLPPDVRWHFKRRVVVSV